MNTAISWGANLERLARSGTVWVPTLMPMQAYAEMAPPGGPEASVCRRNLEHQMTAVAEARRLGVRIAAGTDAGSVGVRHGRAVCGEIRLLMDAGLALPDAIHAATDMGFECVGIPDMGRIRPGFSPSFLTADGPPGALPEGLERIRFRMVDGRQRTG